MDFDTYHLSKKHEAVPPVGQCTLYFLKNRSKKAGGIRQRDQVVVPASSSPDPNQINKPQYAPKQVGHTRSPPTKQPTKPKGSQCYTMTGPVSTSYSSELLHFSHNRVKIGQNLLVTKKNGWLLNIYTEFFFAVREWMQVVAVAKWSPKGWACNTLNFWATTFSCKVISQVAW